MCICVCVHSQILRNLSSLSVLLCLLLHFDLRIGIVSGCRLDISQYTQHTHIARGRNGATNESI